jgi:hypothetical protein
MNMVELRRELKRLHAFRDELQTACFSIRLQPVEFFGTGANALRITECGIYDQERRLGRLEERPRVRRIRAESGCPEYAKSQVTPPRGSNS